MVLSCVKYEFQRKNFGFHDATPDDFYASQWFRQRSFFVAYRSFLFTYCLVWAVVNTMYYDRAFPSSVRIAYMSNWGEWLQAAYFGVALAVAVHGLALSEDLATDDEARDCCQRNEKNKGQLRWFHRLHWALFAASTPIQYAITITYWPLLADGSTAFAISLDQHAINSVLATIDLLMCRVPVRFLHFIYAVAFSVFYILLTLVLHGAGIVSKFYDDLLDWKRSPGISAGVCLGIVVLVIPLLQMVILFFYQVRSFVAKRLLTGHNKSKSDRKMEDKPIEDAEDNPLQSSEIAVFVS